MSAKQDFAAQECSVGGRVSSMGTLQASNHLLQPELSFCDMKMAGRTQLPLLSCPYSAGPTQLPLLNCPYAAALAQLPGTATQRPLLTCT